MPAIDYTEDDRLERDFVSRGLVILPPDRLGIPAEVHRQLFEREKALVDAGEAVTPGGTPEVLEVLRAPGLVDACNRLVGRNWAVVPFTHNAPFVSAGRDQHWHKDDNSPLNGRRQRHHQPVQVEMLYFPQAVSLEMGPTATVPYSQYWARNHEENQDNFSGADHIDFDFNILGLERQMVSGPDSAYDPDDIRETRTAHDIRMRQAIADTGWPLVRQFEAGPLQAGSVIIYSHNIYHRGNHRRDDWHTWADNPRFMWRFWMYRTTDPDAGDVVDAANGVDWREERSDPLTGIDLSNVDDDIITVWRYHHHWLTTGRKPAPSNEGSEAEHLAQQLRAMHDAAEPLRIGAAYRLAALEDTEVAVRLLTEALRDERESVRRAATYGLVAVGAPATDAFIEATQSPVKWVRKAGVYGLGDASRATAEVVSTLAERLAEDPSVYVRSVAAGSLGCLGRRALATSEGAELVPECALALVASLGREENRVGMDVAQNRSIKFVRPTDESDVCEGGGTDYGMDDFEPVRSAVREAALWSLVVLTSHGPDVLSDALAPVIDCLRAVVRDDRNIFSVGTAMDALCRITHLGAGGAPVEAGAALPPAVAELRDQLPNLLRQRPARPWETLVPGGLPPATLADYEEIAYARVAASPPYTTRPVGR